MNNHQNNNARRSVSPSKAVSKKSETYGSVHGTKKKEGNADSIRPTGALKIFFESESLNFQEPRLQWNFKNARRKKSPGDPTTLSKSICEENGKVKKEAKKTQKEEVSTKKNNDKPSFYSVLESQLGKKKSGGFCMKPGDSGKVFGSEMTKIHSITERFAKKVEHENIQEPHNSFSALRKKHEGKKSDKTETVPKVASPSILPESMLYKTPGKISTGTPAPDVKLTNSDYGKIRINEILKGHAQKVQVKTSNPVKEYSFQGVTELIQKVNNITGGAVHKEEKESPIKESQEKPKEEEKPKTVGKAFKDSSEVKQVSMAFVVNDDSSEEKKVPHMWMKVPQSNELERRLKNSWEQPGYFLQGNEEKSDGSLEEEKKGKKPDVQEEDEKKSEKRTTYTDQLLLLRTLGKGKVGTVTEDEHQNKTTETVVPEKTEPPIKRIENPVQLCKEIALPPTKEMILLKDPRQNEGEQIFKTKATRSTELRDLVTQAVKEHKIFCIFDNHWYIVRPVREELLSRGWLEVIPDRKLIPRRRPPPMGPTYDRDKSFADRNCNTLEAILAAKETFADELSETVSKSSSFRVLSEKPKLPPPASHPAKKSSEDSLNEVLSLFRIIPPTAEKKKNNAEIREFVTKYQTMLDKDNEKEKKSREKNTRAAKKEKPKTGETDQSRNKKSSAGENPPESQAKLIAASNSLQAILNTINDNKKTILQAAVEMKGLESKLLNETFGTLFTSKMIPSIESGETEPQEKPPTKGNQNASKAMFTDNEAKTISKIIQSTNARIHFMWLSIKPSIHLKCFNYSPEIVNKFQKTTFCTKIGLWSHLNSIQWYAHEVHFPAKSPRMYNTGEADDLQAFFQDFQLTACIGMLKWLADTFFDRGMKAVQTKKGKVPLKAFEFAIKQCEKYIRFKDNEDLGILEEPKVLQEEWNTFLQWFYIITNDHGKVQESSSAQLMVVYTKAIETLKTMKKHWPEIDIDGRLNIWIMKPYCASCGRGIFMTNNVYYIGQHSKYIVQKYIERPLLIYNTKFDIRQWFMITKLTPLEIWMYKECYLRFCTQPFALRNLHESVHLSNNSVQRKYISLRDPGLPDQNMWDSNTFQLYLKTIGHPTAWQDIIYPGMRDAIVSTMLAAQDTFDGPRRSWFEVYGADFMLSANVKDGPWLIEINENPAMDPSTKVTARLCPQMLRDVIKVVVDKRSNKNASTGEWELVYRQNYSPSFGTVDLDVRGKKIARVPHTTKISLNLPIHPSTSPTNVKRQSAEESAGHKLYELVKSYDTKKNSRGDCSLGGKQQQQDQEKTQRLSKVAEKESLPGNPRQAVSNLKIKKSDLQERSQVLIHLEKKYSKKISEENQGEEKEKAMVQTLEVRSINISAENLGGKQLKEDKKSIPIISSKNGLRKVRNSSIKLNSKKTIPEKGRSEAKEKPSETRFSSKANKKNDADQEQSNLQNEKYKFTKFYNV